MSWQKLIYSFIWTSQIVSLLLVGILADFSQAQEGQAVAGSFELVAGAPEKGFYWPYFLVVPEFVESSAVILLEATDSSFDFNTAVEDFSPDEDAYSRADYFGFNLFAGLGSPLVMAVLPHLPAERFENGDIFWALHLDNDIFTTDLAEYKRLDLQIEAMVEDAKTKLAARGIQTADRVFADGFSSTGIFALRFALLHPDRIMAAAVGGAGIHMMPQAQWRGMALPYPVGTAEMEALTGEVFDQETFQTVPLFIYVGQEDRNDPVGVMDPQHAALVRQLFGETVLGRFSATEELYTSVTSNSEFNIYPGEGHFLSADMVADVNSFFRQHLVDPEIKVNGRKGTTVFSAGAPLTVSISLDAGARIGRPAEWWVTADTDFGRFSYVYPHGWQAGLRPAAQFPLFSLPGDFQVLNMSLPAGEYLFSFAIDETPDGEMEPSWIDTMTVQIE